MQRKHNAGAILLLAWKVQKEIAEEVREMREKLKKVMLSTAILRAFCHVRHEALDAVRASSEAKMHRTARTPLRGKPRMNRNPRTI